MDYCLDMSIIKIDCGLSIFITYVFIIQLFGAYIAIDGLESITGNQYYDGIFFGIGLAIFLFPIIAFLVFLKDSKLMIGVKYLIIPAVLTGLCMMIIDIFFDIPDKFGYILLLGWSISSMVLYPIIIFITLWRLYYLVYKFI